MAGYARTMGRGPVCWVRLSDNTQNPDTVDISAVSSGDAVKGSYVEMRILEVIVSINGVHDLSRMRNLKSIPR